MRHILLTLLFSGGLLAAPAQEPRSERYRFPVRNVAGLYSANFGEMRPNHFHSGVDIKTDGVTGKPVVAAADGYVVRIAVSPGRHDDRLRPPRTLPHRHRILPALQTLRAGAQQRRFHLQAFVIPRPRGRHGRPVGQFGHVVRAASPLRGAPQLRPADTQHAGRETAARTRPYRTPHHAAALRRGRLARRRSRPQPPPHLRRGTPQRRGLCATADATRRGRAARLFHRRVLGPQGRSLQYLRHLPPDRRGRRRGTLRVPHGRVPLRRHTLLQRRELLSHAALVAQRGDPPHAAGRLSRPLLHDDEEPCAADHPRRQAARGAHHGRRRLRQPFGARLHGRRQGRRTLVPRTGVRFAARRPPRPRLPPRGRRRADRDSRRNALRIVFLHAAAPRRTAAEGLDAAVPVARRRDP